MNISSGCSTSFVSSSHDRIRKPSHGFHISGRNKGIREIDLSLVFGNSTLLSSSTCKSANANSQFDNEIQGMLALITSFDLSRNEIEHLNNLCALRSLCELDVSYNLISQITGLPSTLTRLNLSHNKLRNLDGVSSLLHLRDLDVSSNRLTNFMGLSSRLPLQTLRADDNRIVSTLGLEEMPHLRLLSMSNNFIESVNELLFLQRAVSLQSLNLRNNPIAQFNGYRQLVAQRQVALLTLDEEPILHYPDRVSTGDYKGLPVAEVDPSPAATEIITKRGRTKLNKIESMTPESAEFGVRDIKFDNSSPNDAWFQHDRSQDVGRSVITPERQQLPKSLGRHTSTEQMESPAPVASVHPPEPILMNSKPTFSEDPNESHPMKVGTQSFANAQICTSPLNSYTKQFLATRTPQSCSVQQTICAVTPGSLSSSRKRSAVAKATPKNRSLLPQQRQRDSREDGSEKCSNESRVSPHNSFTSSSAHRHDLVGDHSTMARLHDSLVTQEQLKRDNQMLRAKLKNVEDQLSESRRVISEQLSKLSNSRVAIDALRHAESDLKEQLERSKRHAKTVENHHKDEIKTLQTQYERTKAFYEAQIADLQQQLTVELNRPERRTVSKSNDKHTIDSSLPLPRPLPDLITSVTTDSKNLSTAELSSDDPEEGLGEQNLANTTTDLNKSATIVRHAPLDSHTSATNLAERLKAWLLHELVESGPKAEVEASHDKLMKFLNLPNKRSEGPEQGGGKEASFAVGAQAILEAIVLSKQYSIQRQSDPDPTGVEDESSRHSQSLLPQEAQQHLTQEGSSIS
ncbi:unnamed protein product [Phytomonas sp. EM1]|nr:unnamed protein product [Phytomonas sp. EM1]|eukprot:CCW64026.1 unnamed protein product [Phytomonas sp. isolate EM1]